jgi:Tfp pilus assembly protein PilO
MALNKRERLLVAVTATFIVLGGNYLLLSPLAKKWGDLRVKTGTAHHELDSIVATLQRAPGWQKEYDQLRQSVGEKSEKFQETSDVLKKLEEEGASSGILIKERRAMPAEDKGVYRELPVVCRFESTIESLVKFLYGLQTGSGFISVQELQVTGQPDNASILRCDIKIQVLAGKSAGGDS